MTRMVIALLKAKMSRFVVHLNGPEVIDMSNLPFNEEEIKSGMQESESDPDFFAWGFLEHMPVEEFEKFYKRYIVPAGYYILPLEVDE